MAKKGKQKYGSSLIPKTSSPVSAIPRPAPIDADLVFCFKEMDLFCEKYSIKKAPENFLVDFLTRMKDISSRAVERITGIGRDTLCDLVLRVGQRCERFFAAKIVDLQVDDVQCDEIHSFVGMRAKQQMDRDRSPEFGDSWTWIAIERNSKMVLAFQIGNRDNYNAQTFLRKVNNATTGHFQISTDGLNQYTNNVPFTFGSRVDFGQLIKSFQGMQSTIRYAPGTIIASEKRAIYGNPDHYRICTSHIESFNQKFRAHLKRFARLTAAHSKSVTHHEAMQAIYFCFYNFCRKHETIKMTPAMAAGLTEKQWTISDLLAKIV